MKAHLHDCCGDYFRPPELRKHFTGAPNNMFPPLEDTLIHRTAMDKHPGSSGRLLRYDVIYTHPPNSRMDSMEMMESTLCSPSLPPAPHPNAPGVPYTMSPPCSQPDDLEGFAERFRQRRIKMGVTQADVGKALVHLKLPGVGTLSQSTICRFESLTLSRNNMIALKPVLQSWLEAAEQKKVLPPADRKKKRTSIAAIERRSLEAYFAVQQRPSSDKIASIAHKLDLKKSVVRVWFCNQRQKQKRMKYAAPNI